MATTHKRKTPLAASELGISYHRLIALIRFGRMSPPERDTSGHYWWSDTDLKRAREALKNDRRRKVAKVAATEA
jgi:hypothetical protein